MAAIQTIVFIKKEEKILLGLKQRGIGAFKWNGFGGKAKRNETPEECAKREVFEESGIEIEVSDLKYIGFINYGTTDVVDRKVYLYLCDKFKGVPRDSEEMQRITWFAQQELPMEDMLEDCNFWMWMIFKGIKFVGRLSSENNEIISANFHLL